MFSLLWNELLLRPVYNIFLLLLELLGGNLWRAIIVLTLLVRLALYNNSKKWTAMQSQMGELQPKMQEIQEKYKDDPEKLSKETMKLLKKDGAWPLKWCLSLLFQIPVFYGLYAVIYNIANPEGVRSFMKFPLSFSDMVYSFLHPIVDNMIDVANMTTNFLGLDVLWTNSIVLAVIAGILMFLNMSVMTWIRPATPKLANTEAMPDMGSMMKYMNYFLVIIIAWFVYSVASGIGLYIATSTLFALVQVYLQHRILIDAKLMTIFGIKPKPQIVEKRS